MGFDGQKPSVARLHPTAVVGCDLERKYLVTGQILLGRLRKTYCTFIGYIIYIYIYLSIFGTERPSNPLESKSSFVPPDDHSSR